MKKNLIFFILSLSIFAQEKTSAYVEIDKTIYLEINKPVASNLLDSISLNNITIKEVEKPYAIKDSLIKEAFNPTFKVDEMVVYKNCGMYYSNQARLVCMSNSVFKDVFQYLEFPKQTETEKVFGSVIFSYVIDKDGAAIPYSLSYNSSVLKDSVLSAINKWFKTIKDYKSTPAMVEKKPINYLSEVIFTYLLEEDIKEGSTSILSKDIYNNSEIILDTALKKEEILKIKVENKVDIVKPK